MIASGLKTNYLTRAMGIDPGEAVLTWIPEGGIRQTAFRVTLSWEGRTVSDSSKVVSSGTEYAAPLSVPSRTRATWSVTLWDENDVPGAPTSMEFETGIAPADWAARWIEPELTPPEFCLLATDDVPLNKASYLRREFTLSEFRDARLYITAHGIYDAWINGVHVDGYFLAPGTGDYDHRLQVQTYDVGPLLKPGRNEILVSLGEGWWRGSHGWCMYRCCYGTALGLLCQLEADGKPVLRTDGTWQASQNGPLEENDTMRLERFDARKEITDWHGVRVADYGFDNLVGTCVPITTHESFPARLITTPNGQGVLDFGQNMAGFVRLDLTAAGGETIRLTHGDVLGQDGNFQNDNFQNPESPICRQVIEYTCRPGRNIYHQTKCYYGFRYALLETDMDLTGEEFTAVAVYSDMAQTGFFTCGVPEVNQLFRNSLWSMKSNFVDIPTDCPHREKLGFTGDAQVFSDAALYLMDSYPVLLRWLREVAAAQYENGCVPQVVPRWHQERRTAPGDKDGSAGWCDAFQIIPYRMMRRWNSLQAIRELYPGIRRWLRYNLDRAKDTRPEHAEIPEAYRFYLLDTATNWGEWCEPGWGAPQYSAEGAATGHAEVATAFLAQGLRMAQEMAQRLGEAEDEAFFRDAYEKVRAAYRYVFTREGAVASDRQCRYVRPIAHGLLSEAESRAAAEGLAVLIARNGNKIGTGFLTTCYLCDVLTDYGYSSVAYDLLLQRSQPSWLFEVLQGATTVWESWYGIQEDGTPRGSHNHYSFGAVSEWLLSRVLGIRVADGHITLRPYPDRRLGFAEGSYLSPFGKIAAAWRYEGDEILYRFEVPSNSDATVILPDGSKTKAGPGAHSFRVKA